MLGHKGQPKCPKQPHDGKQSEEYFLLAFVAGKRADNRRKQTDNNHAYGVAKGDVRGCPCTVYTLPPGCFYKKQ